MSDPALGLLMLGLIVVVIMMGFATAFTLMGLGMFFGFIAFYSPAEHWWQNRVFDLMVQRTYGAMTNDVLISIPLFVLMGYVMERGALVDKMFYSIQLAFRNVPASLAVATLIVCTFWGIASGLVGAVVVLMGVIAFNPMLRAGYDVKLAAGVITAGGTLGILIPPSVMIIVYAAVAGQSVVKLYAAAMFPGFFLALLYLVYIIGWALLNPKIAPTLPPEQVRVPVPGWMPQFQAAYSPNMFTGLVRALFSPSKARTIEIDGKKIGYGALFSNLAYALIPFIIVAGTLYLVWWYVVIHQQAAVEAVVTGVEQLGTPGLTVDGPAPSEEGPPAGFYYWFFGIAVVLMLLQVRYYRKMDAARLEIVKLVSASTMPLGVLTVVVLGVILFGITTATESAAVGAAGAFLLAFHATSVPEYTTALVLQFLTWY
jgi:TRAP-type mannitol/chloroaromatic compound transport system permease large subunit